MTDEPTDLTRLFEAHKDGLTGAVRGMLGRSCDLAEVLQEVFLRALRAERNGRLRGDPVGFLYVTTLNHARDLRRRALVAGRPRPLEEVPAMSLTSSDPHPAVRLQRSEAVAAAREAIRALSDREKEVFFLRVNAGLTFEKVASQLEIPVGTAKTRMRQALTTLRQRLQPHADPAEPRS